LAWVAWRNTEDVVCPKTISHPSIVEVQSEIEPSTVELLVQRHNHRLLNHLVTEYASSEIFGDK